jgi:hypothetical protein
MYILTFANFANIFCEYFCEQKRLHLVLRNSLGVLFVELQPVRDGWAATLLYKG